MSKQELYYRNAWAGDYSDFEKLAPEAREDLANRYMNELSKRNHLLGSSAPNNSPHFSPSEKVNGLLEEQSMNPLFRLGCSLRAKAESDNKLGSLYRQYDDYMNAYLMKQSLSPLDKNRLQALKDQGLKGNRLDDEVKQNVEKQTLLAKTLFLSHLGKTQLVETGEPGAAPQKKALDRPVSSMVAHCSRTSYVFPPGSRAQQDKIFNAILGADMGKDAGVYRRMAATHSVSSGPTIEDFKEEKKFSMANQYGMNLSIGGLGNPGISGPDGYQILKNDGSCGHMYMHVDKGGADKCSSLLVGFESDAPGVTNQQGHTHNAKASPEAMSSFLGQRSDEMGMKYGGRIVDCTQLSPHKLAEVMNEFTAHYRTLLVEGMESNDVRRELNEINDSLCGSPMSRMELTAMMGKIGIEKEKIKTMLDNPLFHTEERKPAECVRQLNFEQNGPKRPGTWTKFKAALGGSGSKKACQEYESYQASLTSRAEKGVDTEGRKIPAKNSIEQYVGKLDAERPWKEAQAAKSYIHDSRISRPEIGIGYHREKEAERGKYFYIPNRNSLRQPSSSPIPEASFIPPMPDKAEAPKASFIPPGMGNTEASRASHIPNAPDKAEAPKASFIPP
ncbi:MAG: hypothetical protein LIP16_11875, partial [Clostridium sp.]|nr:hypothetical protein [Clostridium sp.]